MIAGKGFFIWRSDRVIARSGGSVAAAAQMAVAARVQHALVKIADGSEPYPIHHEDPTGEKEQMTADLIRTLQNAGIDVWGWSFVYGDRSAPEMQAQTFARRAQQFQLKSLVINAERSWKNPQGASRALAFVQALRAEMGNETTLAVSSYRYPSFHSDFPYDAFMAMCDIAMPQVYWAAFGGQEGDAVLNLQKSYDEFQRRFPHKMFAPTGAAFGEPQPDGSFWSATPHQIERFMRHAQSLGLPAVNFWSWEHAIGDPENPKMSGTELWDAAANFVYDPSPEPPRSTPPPPIGEETEREPELIQFGVGDPEYRDGLHPQFPQAELFSFERNGVAMKYANSVSTSGSVWAAWSPQLPASGVYHLRAWIPGKHATTKQARYHIHGVIGQTEPIVVEIDQSQYFDEWVELGLFELDVDLPQSGQAQLTNHTGEANKEVGFAGMQWELSVEREDSIDAGIIFADGFDPPVGSDAERQSGKIWPGKWFDVTGYNVLYTIRREQTAPGQYREVKAIHTGADLNLPQNQDRRSPLYAIASGEVIFSTFKRGWGELLIIRHDPLAADQPPIYSRYAHMYRVDVHPGDRVERGQKLGIIGEGDPARPFGAHLHFDISHTDILGREPTHWPGLRREEVTRHYLDPKKFISENRPVKEAALKAVLEIF